MSKESKQHAKEVKRVMRETKKLERKAENARIRHAWKTLPWAKRPKEFSSDYVHKWNVHEEVVNSITHALGFFLGIAALVLMVVYAAQDGSVYGVVSGAIFGSSLIIAYASSAIYHAILYPPLKRFFRIMDHSCIFLLIAGTYTPFCLVTLHGALGWTLFGVVWGLAAIGITMKFLFFDSFKVLSTVIYLGMGWLAVAVIVQLLQNLPMMGCIWMLAGGLAYTIGVIFFVYERVPFFHAVWHLFVLAGSICHFFAIYLYVMPVHGLH